MPLKRGTSNDTREHNIREMVRSGKSLAQATAIAYEQQRRARSKRKSKASQRKIPKDS